MPDQNDMDNFNRLRNNVSQPAMPPPPPLPQDIKDRFPSMAQWEVDFMDWAIVNLGIAIQGQQ